MEWKKITVLCILFVLAVNVFMSCSPEESEKFVYYYDFEDGDLGEWELQGSGGVVTGDFFDPAINDYSTSKMAYITTLNNEGAYDYGYYDDSPDIDSNGVKESECSALYLDKSLPAGTTITISYLFLTDEFYDNAGSPAVGDYDLYGMASDYRGDAQRIFLYSYTDGVTAYTGDALLLEPDEFEFGYIYDGQYFLSTVIDDSQFYSKTSARTEIYQLTADMDSLCIFVADSHTDGVASALLIDKIKIEL